MRMPCAGPTKTPLTGSLKLALMFFGSAIVILGLKVVAVAQQPAERDAGAVYSGMQWRLIGPHRAGRVTAVAGIPGQPLLRLCPP